MIEDRPKKSDSVYSSCTCLFMDNHASLQPFVALATFVPPQDTCSVIP